MSPFIYARNIYSNFSNYLLSALFSVDTMRLLKELYTYKKGKAFNFLSLIIKIKIKIL